MSQTQLLRVRIRAGCTEQILAYLEKLGRERKAAESLLAEQGIQSQQFFVERGVGGDPDFLYYLITAKDLMKAGETAALSEHPFSLEARQLVEETWAGATSPEPLLSLKAKARAKTTARNA
jgi:hypothetical protein